MQLEQLFQMAIQPGDTVIDIGAFDGDFAVRFSGLVGAAGKVYSFEPHPQHFLELAKKAYLVQLRNVFPYCRAMADFSGHCPIYLAPPATAKSSTIIAGLGEESRLGPGIQTCLAETQTLDDFVRATSCKPSFVKIDTEGAEKLVFAGAKRVLEAFRPLLVFEGSFGYSAQRQAYCFNEAVPSHVAWLESIGYHIFILDIDYFDDAWVAPDSPAHCMGYGLLAVKADEFRHFPVMGCNLLAVPAQHPFIASIGTNVPAVRALDYFAGVVPLHDMPTNR